MLRDSGDGYKVVSGKDQRSPVGLQLCQRAREAHLASESAQASIGRRRRNELKPSTDGLGDTSTASLLRLLKKRQRNLYCNLPRGIHSASHYAIFETSIEYDISYLGSFGADALRWQGMDRK